MESLIKPPNFIHLDHFVYEMKQKVSESLNRRRKPNDDCESFYFPDLDSKEGKKLIDDFRVEIEKAGWTTYRRGAWLFVFAKPISLFRRIFLFNEV